MDNAPEEPESGIGSDNDSGSPLIGRDLLPPEDIDEFIARNFVHSPPKASQPSDSTLKFLRDLEASQVKVTSREVIVGTTSFGRHGSPPEAEEMTREAPSGIRHLGMRDGDSNCSRNNKGKRRDAGTKSVTNAKLSASEVFADAACRISSKPASAQSGRSGIWCETLRARLPHTTCFSRNFDAGDLERKSLNDLHGRRLDFQSTAFTTARSPHPVRDTTNSDELGVSSLLGDSRGDDSKDLGKVQRSLSEVESATPTRLGEPAALAKDDSEKRSCLMSESVKTADVPLMRSQKPVPVKPVPVRPVPLKPVPMEPIMAKSVPMEPDPVKRSFSAICDYDPNEFLRVPVRRRNGRLTPVTSTLRPRLIDGTQSIAKEITGCKVPDKVQVMDSMSIQVVDSAMNDVADCEMFQVVYPEKIDACLHRGTKPRARCSSVQEEPVWSKAPTSGSTVRENFSTSGASVLKKIRARLNGSAKSGVSRPISKVPRSQCVDEEQSGVAGIIGKPSRPKSSTMGTFIDGPKESKRKTSKAVNSVSSQHWIHADQYSNDLRGTKWNEMEQHNCTSPTFHTFLGNVKPLRWTEEGKKGECVWQEADDVVSTGTKDRRENGICKQGGQWNVGMTGQDSNPTSLLSGKENLLSRSWVHDAVKPNRVEIRKGLNNVNELINELNYENGSNCANEPSNVKGLSSAKVLSNVNELSNVKGLSNVNLLNTATVSNYANGSNCVNELSNVKGLSNATELSSVNGLKKINGPNKANGLNCDNGLRIVNGLSKVNGLNFSNRLNDVNESKYCLNFSGGAVSELKVPGSRQSPRRLPLCPLQNLVELDSSTTKIRGSGSWKSTSIPLTTSMDGLKLDCQKDSGTTCDDWSVNFDAATAASEASSAISKLLQCLYSESSPCSASPVNDRTVLRVDFDDRKLALMSAHDRFTGDCRSMTCSAPRSKAVLVDAIGTSMRSFTELVYRSSRLVESISLRTETDKVKDAVKVVANAYQRTMTAASDGYSQALRSSNGYSQALRSSHGYSEALRSSDGYSEALCSSDLNNKLLTSTYSNPNQSPESDAAERKKWVRKAIQQPASELVDALCSLKTLIQNLDYDKLPRRF